MIYSNLILMHGLIYTGGFVLIILISVLINPRIWMQDFPEDIKTNITPKSNKEIKQTFVTGFLFALFIVGFPLYSLSEILSSSQDIFKFSSLLLFSFSIMMICNIFYWLIFDLLIFNLIISHIRIVPEMKKKFKFPGWKRQIFGLFIGILTCGFISLFVATIAWLFS
ncbi:MAG: hypothetical protein PF518_15415 [Spirochaetaceae bacterium]|jgi:hypothetical protein|nr:hypothetical protein [Spirochaetaceae bacterium]